MPMTTRGKNRAPSSDMQDFEDPENSSSNDELEQPTDTIQPSSTPVVTKPAIPDPAPVPKASKPVASEVSKDYEEAPPRNSFSDSDSEYESEGEKRRKRKLPYAKRVKKEIEEKAARKNRKLSVDVDSSPAGIPPAFPENISYKGVPMVEKILAHRVDPKTSALEYLVKWKDRSYLHISWVGPDEFQRERYSKTKLQRYHNKGEVLYDESEELFNPAFVEADRIIGHSEQDGVTKYLVKWQQMSYLEASWELPTDIGDDTKIKEYLERQKAPSPNRWRPKPRPPSKSWKPYEESPIFKGGNQLRSYQLEGLNWLTFCWYNRRNSILADEMGLGKTVQTVMMLNHLFEDVAMHGPFMIVAPLITIPHWQREFESWTNINVVVYHGNAPARDVIRNYEFYYDQKKAPPYKFNVLITTYEMAMSDVSILGKIHWNYVAVDEAHRLKNKNCKLINVLRTFRIDHLLLLTGTPLQNNTDELWTLLNFMDPEKFSSAEEFAEQFGELKETRQVEELHTVLRPYLLRRMKEDVEKGIAPKEETVVEVELTTIQKSYYRAIYEKNFSSLNMGSKSTNVPSLLNIMMQLRKCCNHPFLLRGVEDNIMGRSDSKSDENQLMINASGKLVLIDKLLPKLQAGGHKVLIFSQMVRMLDILEDYLIHKSYLYERIDGTKRGSERQEAIDRFSAPDSDRFVFLLCTRAGGLGINLTAADTCIIYDSDWNPQNDIQAQARCHRIGQTQMVKIYRLITRNTYEKVMFDKASRKLGLDQAVLTKMKSGAATASSNQAMSQNAALRAMDRKEIDQLLKYGAYGAFDETEHDSYIEEDIDKILERNSTTIVHNPLGITTSSGDGEGGSAGTQASSSFSKASFISAEAKSNADLDVSDPDFWKKLMPDKKISNPLIQAKPRTRNTVQRYSLRGGGGASERIPFYESSGSEASDNDDNDEFEGTAGWTSRERSKLKSSLAFYGYGQWYTAKEHGNIFRWSVAQIKAYTDILIRNCIIQMGEEPEPILQYLQTNCIYESPPAEPSKRDNLAIEDFMDFSEDPSLTDTKFSLYKYSNAKLFIRRLESIAKISKAVLQTYDELGGDKMSILELAPDPPCESWTQEDDRSLILGTYYHGYGRYEKIRTDPRLSFSRFMLDPSSGTSSTTTTPEEWPSEKLLNRRLRKVLRLVSLDDEAREKHQQKKEKIEKAQRKDRQARRGYSHSEWSKREKALIYRFSVTFGIPMPDSDDEDWNQFKMQAGITRKPISQIKEYCAGLLAYADMTVKGPQSVFTIDSDVFMIDHFVETDLKLSTAQSKRLLQRVHMFREIRAKLLPRLDELPDLLQTAHVSQALPLWWKPAHDYALITGLSKHGFGQWEKLCADPDLPFYHLAEERLALSDAQEKAKLSSSSSSTLVQQLLPSESANENPSADDSMNVDSTPANISTIPTPSGDMDSSQDVDMKDAHVSEMNPQDGPPPPTTLESSELTTPSTTTSTLTPTTGTPTVNSPDLNLTQMGDEKEEPLDEDSDSIPDDDDDGEPRRRRGRRADVYTTAVDFPKEKVIMKRLDYLIQFVDRPDAFSGGVTRKLTPHPFKIEKPLSSSSGSVPSTPESGKSKSSGGTPGSSRKHKICAGRKPATKKYHEIPMDPSGNPKFPIMFGKMRVESLGEVVYDRPGFHNDRYIWPVGYKSVRPYQSFVNPLSRTEYCSEIADGGDRPLFVVTAVDAPDRPGKGTSPTAAWTSILRKLNEKSNKPFNAVSGPEYFGLAKGIISKLIQELPNAEKCFNYQKQEFLLDSEQPPRKKRKSNRASQPPATPQGGTNSTPSTPTTTPVGTTFETSEIPPLGIQTKNSSPMNSPPRVIRDFGTPTQGGIPPGALIDYPPPPPSSSSSSILAGNLHSGSSESSFYGTLPPPPMNTNSFVMSPFPQPTFTNVTFNFRSSPIPPPPVPSQYMESDSAIPFPVIPPNPNTQFSPHNPTNSENHPNFPF